MKPSVVILTYNSELSIRDTLASVATLTDDIHIVDSFSQDATLEIARGLGVQITQSTPSSTTGRSATGPSKIYPCATPSSSTSTPTSASPQNSVRKLRPCRTIHPATATTCPAS